MSLSQVVPSFSGSDKGEGQKDEGGKQVRVHDGVDLSRWTLDVTDAFDCGRRKQLSLFVPVHHVVKHAWCL